MRVTLERAVRSVPRRPDGPRGHHGLAQGDRRGRGPHLRRSGRHRALRVRGEGQGRPHHRQEERGLLEGRPAQDRQDRVPGHRRRERPVPEPAERRARPHRLDTLGGVQGACRKSGDYKVSIVPGLGYQGIWLNVTQPPFDNKELRQAVYRLVDREAIVQAVLRNVGGTARQLALRQAVLGLQRGERRVPGAQRRGGEGVCSRRRASPTGSRSPSSWIPRRSTSR